MLGTGWLEHEKNDKEYLRNHSVDNAMNNFKGQQNMLRLRGQASKFSDVKPAVPPKTSAERSPSSGSTSQSPCPPATNRSNRDEWHCRRCWRSIFSPTAKLAMWFLDVFSPEKLWCDPVQLQRKVPEKVPEGSGRWEASGADG